MSKPDSFAAIFHDASRTVQRHARNAANAIAPHLTLDNAQRVATLVQTVVGIGVALHQRPAPAPKRGGR